MCIRDRCWVCLDGSEVGPQISADIDGIEDEEIHHIDIWRDGGGFGFSIRGGAEYNSHLFVLRIAENGAADKDGRLMVGDELLEINGNSTEGMLHSDAITIIKHGGEKVRLIVRRLPEHQRQYSQSDVPPIPQQQFSSPDITPIGSRGNSSSRELLNGKSPNVTNTHEKYARDYMNSSGRNRNSIQDQYGSDTDPPVDGNLVTENNTDQ